MRVEWMGMLGVRILLPGIEDLAQALGRVTSSPLVPVPTSQTTSHSRLGGCLLYLAYCGRRLTACTPDV